MGILAHAVDARTTARQHTHSQRPTPNTHTRPTKRMTRHFTTKSFLLVAALLVVAVSAAEAASGSRALLQVINIPLVGTVDFQNVAPFYGQIFSGLIPSDALPFGTDFKIMKQVDETAFALRLDLA